MRAIADCLKPGGLFLIYTISGPTGNARCPFPDPMLLEAGFEVLAYDQDDSMGAWSMMEELHPGVQSNYGPGKELTALYTLARRTADPAARR